MMVASTRTGDKLLRALMLSFGLIYLWFGTLKFFPGVSPAEALSGATIHLLTFGLMEEMLSVRVLAVLEVTIGVLCLLGVIPDKVILLILGHMICTFSPMILLPELVYGKELFSLTLVGQYILKNIVFVCALLIAYKMAKRDESDSVVNFVPRVSDDLILPDSGGLTETLKKESEVDISFQSNLD